MGKDLLVACAVGDVAWVKLCLKKGADPYFLNDEGWSALHMAATNTKLACIEFLVEHLKIDVNLQNNTGWTPLHLASRARPEKAALDCVDYLISSGADVNRVNDMGISSVHQAVSANNLQCLTSLVKHGASVTCTDKRGLLPLDVSKVWGHTACSKYLQNVMWFEKKRDEEKERRKWVAEHRKLLETEIKKYSDSRTSDKVDQAYTAWAKRKGVPPPRLPANCASRAKTFRCSADDSPVIPSFHRSQLTKKCTEQMLSASPRSVSPTTPRTQFARVKKIQELRRTLTARDIMGQTRDLRSHSREPTPPLLSASPKAEDFQPPIPRIRQVKLIREQEIHARISKLAEPKVPRPRKRKKQGAGLQRWSEPTEPFVVKVDNYFQTAPPQFTPSPDSGYSEGTVKSPEVVVEEVNVEGQSAREEEPVLSVHSVLLEDRPESAIELSPSPSKSVRFNDTVFYNTDRKSVPIHNGVDELRSCIKRGLSLKA